MDKSQLWKIHVTMVIDVQSTDMMYSVHRFALDLSVNISAFDRETRPRLTMHTYTYTRIDRLWRLCGDRRPRYARWLLTNCRQFLSRDLKWGVRNLPLSRWKFILNDRRDYFARLTIAIVAPLALSRNGKPIPRLIRIKQSFRRDTSQEFCESRLSYNCAR